MLRCMRCLHKAGFILAVSGLAICASAPAWTDVLFYGGDPIGGGVASVINSQGPECRVYDNFTVPSVCEGPSAWRVDCIFGYYVFDTTEPLNTAQYEIRQGISRGSGGVLLYNGVASAAVTSSFETVDNGTVYRIECPVADGIVLSPGDYWVTLAPIIDEPSKQYFISLSEGVNGIGSPIYDGLSFVDSPSYGYNWAPGTDWYGGKPDSSIGVIGEVVPEPGTAVVLSIGLCGLGRFARRNRRCVDCCQ